MAKCWMLVKRFQSNSSPSNFLHFFQICSKGFCFPAHLCGIWIFCSTPLLYAISAMQSFFWTRGGKQGSLRFVPDSLKSVQIKTDGWRFFILHARWELERIRVPLSAGLKRRYYCCFCRELWLGVIFLLGKNKTKSLVARFCAFR